MARREHGGASDYAGAIHDIIRVAAAGELDGERLGEILLQRDGAVLILEHGERGVNAGRSRQHFGTPQERTSTMTRTVVTYIFLLAANGLSPVQAANDPSRCYAIREPDLRNACLAETRDSKGQCYAIRDPDRRQLCLAQTTSQKSICYNVRDKDRRAACLAGMALP